MVLEAVTCKHGGLTPLVRRFGFTRKSVQRYPVVIVDKPSFTTIPTKPVIPLSKSKSPRCYSMERTYATPLVCLWSTGVR